MPAASSRADNDRVAYALAAQKSQRSRQNRSSGGAPRVRHCHTLTQPYCNAAAAGVRNRIDGVAAA